MLTPHDTPAITSVLQPSAAAPIATFAWASVPNMTTCNPATIIWTYSGPQQQLSITTSPSHDLSLSVDATLQTHTIPTVDLPPGQYTMSVSSSNSLDAPNKDVQFSVKSGGMSCLNGIRSSSLDTTPPPSTSSSSNKAAMFGGIAVGVGGFIALFTATFYVPWKRIFKRSRKPDMERSVLQEHEGQWDTLRSRDASTSCDHSEHLVRHFAPRTMSATPETSEVNASFVSLPRLEPNRRPPSTTLDASDARVIGSREVDSTPTPPPTALKRLEPNRRQPSVVLEVAGLRAPAGEHPVSAPPLPAPAASRPKIDLEAEFRSVTPPAPAVPRPQVDLEAEFKPIARPSPFLDVPIISMPKPGRRFTRQSAISAQTSASTALGDMPLLRPAAHNPTQVVPQTQIQTARVLALAQLNAVMDQPTRLPVQVPLPVATPPPPSPTPSPSSTVPTRASLLPTPTLSSLSSPFSSRCQSSLQRSGSTRSTGSSRTYRKPVPPLDPLDVASIWTTRRSFDSVAFNGRGGSPVPSSTTSQMYRSRDSIFSERIWERPLEEWEREQLRLLARAQVTPSVMDEVLENAGPLPESSWRRALDSAKGATPGLGEGKRGVQVLRHQSFGDMKAMRSVIPEVPPLPAPRRSLGG